MIECPSIVLEFCSDTKLKQTCDRVQPFIFILRDIVNAYTCGIVLSVALYYLILTIYFNHI